MITKNLELAKKLQSSVDNDSRKMELKLSSNPTDYIDKETASHSGLMIIDDRYIDWSTNSEFLNLAQNSPATTIVLQEKINLDGHPLDKKDNTHWVTENDFSMSFLSLVQDFSFLKEDFETLRAAKGVIDAPDPSSLAHLAHEIRNPLTVISVKCSRILKSLQLGNKKDPWIQQIEQDCRKIIEMKERISELSEKTLLLSKEYAKASMQNEESEDKIQAYLLNMVWAAVEECSHICDPRGIQIQDFVDSQIQVTCEPKDFVGALINLIRNSADAIENLDERWIEIRAIQDQNIITMEIIDSGHGIDPKIASKIFDPYFSTKAPDKGTGLGLDIVKNYFESLGGKIRVNESAGNTTFVITLPASQGSVSILG